MGGCFELDRSQDSSDAAEGCACEGAGEYASCGSQDGLSSRAVAAPVFGRVAIELREEVMPCVVIYVLIINMMRALSDLPPLTREEVHALWQN